jgi:hypothetical protein
LSWRGIVGRIGGLELLLAMRRLIVPDAGEKRRQGCRWYEGAAKRRIQNPYTKRDLGIAANSATVGREL